MIAKAERGQDRAVLPPPADERRALVLRAGQAAKDDAAVLGHCNQGRPVVERYLQHHLWHNGFADASAAQLQSSARPTRVMMAQPIRGGGRK
jgi:hypothetical protein